MSRGTTYEAFRVSLVCGIEDGLPLGYQSGSKAVMNGGWGQQIEAGVVMPVVIPGEELLAEAAGILNGAKPVGILRPVLQGLEVGFGEWVVVGNMGTAVSLDHAQVGQE